MWPSLVTIAIVVLAGDDVSHGELSGYGSAKPAIPVSKVKEEPVSPSISESTRTEQRSTEVTPDANEPTFVDELNGWGQRRLTSDLETMAARIADLDRADSQFDWAALRRTKNQFSLFKPTPRSLRREFITDRPDKTINPVTVDAGHFQVETDLATATFDRRPLPPGNGRVDKTGSGGFFRSQPYTAGDKNDYVFLLTNIRVGLLNNTDFHLFLRPFQYLETPNVIAGGESKIFGYGDMRTLVKHNFWGNEGGPTAFALTQYLDIPAGRSGLSTDTLEGGATGAFLFRWPGKTYLGAESGLEMRRDIGGDQYHVEIPGGPIPC